MATPTPLIDWTALVRTVSRAAVTTWSQELIRVCSRPSEPPPEPRAALPAPQVVIDVPAKVVPPTQGSRPPEGCPTCRIDKEILKARGHVESIVLYAEREGKIDPTLPSTIHLSRQELGEARTMTQAFRATAPSLGGQCDAVVVAIDRAAAALPDPAACTVEACAEAMPALTDAMAEATKLAVAHERLVKRVRSNDRLRTLFEEAKASDLSADEFYRRFHTELEGGEHGQ